MRWIPYVVVTAVFTIVALTALWFLGDWAIAIHDPTFYTLMSNFSVIPFFAILFLLTLYSKTFERWVEYFKAHETTATEPTTQVKTETPQVQPSGMTDVAETIARELGKK
jgi:hypothetical protein